MIASVIMITFALLVCVLSGFGNAFTGNLWSETAVFTANGGAVNSTAAPNLAIFLNNTPFDSAANIYGLVFLYTLLIGSIMFTCNLLRSKYLGTLIVGTVTFLGYISAVRWLGPQYAWFSLMVHANFSTHNFRGVSDLPTVSASYILFLCLILILSVLSYRRSRKYGFNFSGEPS